LAPFRKISVHLRNLRMFSYSPPAKTFRAEVTLEKLGIEHHIAQVL
jgi:hypothetical protein